MSSQNFRVYLLQGQHKQDKMQKNDSRHKFINPRITCLLLEVSIQTLLAAAAIATILSCFKRKQDTAPRFSFGENTSLCGPSFIPKAYFATQNETSFVTENCHCTTYEVPEGLFFFLQQLYAQQRAFGIIGRSSFSLHMILSVPQSQASIHRRLHHCSNV